MKVFRDEFAKVKKELVDFSVRKKSWPHPDIDRSYYIRNGNAKGDV